jgi:enterochelin esterase-like enzyme
MTTADDRNNEDVWAEAVAEGGAGDDTPVQDAPSSTHGSDVHGSDTHGGDTHDAVAETDKSSKPATPADFFGPELTPLVDEVRRFATTLGERVSAASTAASNGDSLGALQNLAAPLRSKHPEVYGHLIAAGGELLAAYRAAVSASEKRWTAEKPASSEQIDLD